MHELLTVRRSAVRNIREEPEQKEQIGLHVSSTLPNLFPTKLSFLDGMMIVPLSTHHDYRLSSGQPPSTMRRVGDEYDHHERPNTTDGTGKYQQSSDAGWQKGLPDDEEFVFPRRKSSTDVTYTKSDKTTEGDTNPIGRVPVANDGGLLFTRKPHAGNGDTGHSAPGSMTSMELSTHKQGSATASNIPLTNRKASIIS